MKQRILMTRIYFADVSITKESFILEQHFVSPVQLSYLYWCKSILAVLVSI